MQLPKSALKSQSMAITPTGFKSIKTPLHGAAALDQMNRPLHPLIRLRRKPVSWWRIQIGAWRRKLIRSRG